MRLILAATLAASVLFPLAACAQDPPGVEVRPGSPLLDASRIAARTDTFTMKVDGADPIELVIRTAALGDTALLRVERMSFGAREISVDSFAVRRPGLAPLFVESRGLNGISRLAFPPGRAKGTHTPPEREERTIDETLSEPLFYGNSIDLVLASLPLEAGRSYDLATWTPAGVDGVISVRVARAESVQAGDGARCQAWRLETVDENGTESVYWIEQSTRSLLGYSSNSMEIRIVRHASCRSGPDPARTT
ncbi:MAG TPA: hypothetical protein VF647_09385 [Longimicrobium sp.]|jgi:hypothetical protein